jgi:hypothetical protein
MLQVPLGQPEIIFRSVPLESHKILWSLLGPDQSMGDNVLHLKLFLIIHQFRWGSLVSGSHLLRAGVVGFQVLVGLGVALFTYAITGRASTAVSAAYGALAVVLPAG